jgi:hypothetical protein
LESALVSDDVFTLSVTLPDVIPCYPSEHPTKTLIHDISSPYRRSSSLIIQCLRVDLGFEEMANFLRASRAESRRFVATMLYPFAAGVDGGS